MTSPIIQAYTTTHWNQSLQASILALKQCAITCLTPRTRKKNLQETSENV